MYPSIRSPSRSLKVPREAGANAIVGHGLQRRVINADGQVGANIGAEAAAPGEVDLRPKIDRSHSRIFRRFTLEGVFSFVLARHDHLETEGVIMVQSQIISRPAGPREVVGELVI